MRTVWALLVMAAAAPVLATAAAGSGPAFHFTEPVVGDVIPCEGGFTLTAISGELKAVIHERMSA